MFCTYGFHYYQLSLYHNSSSRSIIFLLQCQNNKNFYCLFSSTYANMVYSISKNDCFVLGGQSYGLYQ